MSMAAVAENRLGISIRIIVPRPKGRATLRNLMGAVGIIGGRPRICRAYMPR